MVPEVIAPESKLARQLVGMLAAANLGIARPTGTYLPSEHGLLIDQEMPATLPNCTTVIPLRPIREGRANVLYRAQIATRMQGALSVVRDRAALITGLLDHKEYTPPILGISWAEEYSRAEFEPDTNGRALITQNFQFRGRI